VIELSDVIIATPKKVEDA